MLYQNDDAITAVATGSGDGAVSIVRVSGKGTFEATDAIFRGGKKISEAASHTILYGRIYAPEGELIDDVLVSVFRGPNSYTGEDSVEISSHGSYLITQKIISALMNSGVRLAEPGEFTRRAFLNGKIDLAQAEAVADVINSRTEAALRGARNQLDGLLSAKVNVLREALINTSALVELELDFAEEELEFLSNTEVIEKINEVTEEINTLLRTYTFGRVIREGVNVALVGQPNVGKSSLLNYLLKESRAIVSHIPGTTRDVIREDMNLDGILFRLYDTAGIRLTEDVIEKEGVFRSREAIRNADLVVFINDVESGFSDELHKELLELTEESRIITLFNKIDINRPDREVDVNISAKTGEGIEQLFTTLKQKAVGSATYSEKSAVVTNLRHFNALQKANEFLGNAVDSANGGMSGEFIAVDLRNASNALGEIIGVVTTDDILNSIFSKFCIGK